jgi:hypothetical protein
MSRIVLTKLESLSGYEFCYGISDPRAGQNPVSFVHTTIAAAGETLDVLSRVAYCGPDYSSRANKIAHHVVLRPSERLPGGPGEMLRRLDSTCFRKQWTSAPCELPPLELASSWAAPATPQKAEHWERLTGDAGWAGALAQAFRRDRKTPAFVVFQPGADLLALFQESLAVLPPEERWAVCFSTYYTGSLPPDSPCHWRGVVAGSKAALEIARYPAAVVIGLTKPLGDAPGGDFTEAARVGAMVKPILRAAAVAPASEVSRRQPVRVGILDALEQAGPTVGPAHHPPTAPAVPDPALTRAVRRWKRRALGLAVAAALLLLSNALIVLFIMWQSRKPEEGRWSAPGIASVTTTLPSATQAGSTTAGSGPTSVSSSTTPAPLPADSNATPPKTPATGVGTTHPTKPSSSSTSTEANTRSPGGLTSVPVPPREVTLRTWDQVGEFKRIPIYQHSSKEGNFVFAGQGIDAFVRQPSLLVSGKSPFVWKESNLFSNGDYTVESGDRKGIVASEAQWRVKCRREGEKLVCTPEANCPKDLAIPVADIKGKNLYLCYLRGPYPDPNKTIEIGHGKSSQTVEVFGGSSWAGRVDPNELCQRPGQGGLTRGPDANSIAWVFPAKKDEYLGFGVVISCDGNANGKIEQHLNSLTELRKDYEDKRVRDGKPIGGWISLYDKFLITPKQEGDNVFPRFDEAKCDKEIREELRRATPDDLLDAKKTGKDKRGRLIPGDELDAAMILHTTGRKGSEIEGAYKKLLETGARLNEIRSHYEKIQDGTTKQWGKCTLEIHDPWGTVIVKLTVKYEKLPDLK